MVSIYHIVILYIYYLIISTFFKKLQQLSDEVTAIEKKLAKVQQNFTDANVNIHILLIVNVLNN